MCFRCLRISIRGSVRRPVGPSIRRFVSPFVLPCKTGYFFHTPRPKGRNFFKREQWVATSWQIRFLFRRSSAFPGAFGPLRFRHRRRRRGDARRNERRRRKTLLRANHHLRRYLDLHGRHEGEEKIGKKMMKVTCHESDI